MLAHLLAEWVSTSNSKRAADEQEDRGAVLFLRGNSSIFGTDEGSAVSGINRHKIAGVPAELRPLGPGMH